MVRVTFSPLVQLIAEEDCTIVDQRPDALEILGKESEATFRLHYQFYSQHVSFTKFRLSFEILFNETWEYDLSWLKIIGDETSKLFKMGFAGFLSNGNIRDIIKYLERKSRGRLSQREIEEGGIWLKINMKVSTKLMNFLKMAFIFFSLNKPRVVDEYLEHDCLNIVFNMKSEGVQPLIRIRNMQIR
jgi:hypothetical protein